MTKYLVEGYVVNEKRLSYLEKQINLISIASRLDEKLISDEGNKILSDSALVAITILIAESKPEEKEIIIDLIMNFLTM